MRAVRAPPPGSSRKLDPFKSTSITNICKTTSFEDLSIFSNYSYYLSGIMLRGSLLPNETDALTRLGYICNVSMSEFRAF